MSAFASWFGTGAGLTVVGIAWLFMKHYEHLPQKAHPWAMRVVIVFMFLGGTGVASMPIGTWVEEHVLRWGTDQLGGLGTAVAVVGALSMIAVVAIGVIWRPTRQAAFTALTLPIMLGVFATGALHRLHDQTNTPAQNDVVQISSWLGS